MSQNDILVVIFDRYALTFLPLPSVKGLVERSIEDGKPYYKELKE
jgi:hypothetical protein